jgi:hypothetical protein
MSSVVISGDTSGSITLAAPSVAGTNTITLPANTGTVITTASTFGGTGPAFSAYLSADQTISSGVLTKITFDVERFDTNNCFSSSRFTPNVAGYYQINCTMRASASTITNALLEITKSGNELNRVAQTNGLTITGNFSIFGADVVYLNGTTDYIEMWGLVTGTGTTAFNAAASYVTCTFSASLVRGA